MRNLTFSRHTNATTTFYKNFNDTQSGDEVGVRRYSSSVHNTMPLYANDSCSGVQTPFGIDWILDIGYRMLRIRNNILREQQPHEILDDGPYSLSWSSD